MTHNTSAEHRQLVLAVNELFHDLEGEDYDDVHPEIFKRERRRWHTLLRQHAGEHKHPMTVLDLGCGTGFVAMQMDGILETGDTFVCADVSSKMLDIASAAIRKKFPGIIVRTVKLSDESLPIEPESVDIVTMNSVLHHVPDPKRLLREIDRVLRLNGTLFIGHEPNIRFVKQRFLSGQAPLLHAMHPKRLLARFLRFCGVLSPLRQTASDALTEKINAALLERKLIQEPLTRSEIAKLVDVHSPTAGGMTRDVGFDPWNVLNATRGSLDPIMIQTYNHLGKLSGRSAILRPYERLLSMMAPKSGSTFFLVAQKSRSPQAPHHS